MDHNGRGHVLNVSVSTEEARGWLRRGGRGGLLPKAGRVDITSILIESLRSGSSLIGDPGVTHGAFRVVLSVLQLLQVVVDPLWSANFPVTTLKPV